MNIPQKLGIKVFYYYLFQKVFVGILFLVVFFIIASLKSFLVSSLVFIFPLSVAIVIVNYFIVGLFAVSIVFIAGGFLMSWLLYIRCTFSINDDSFNISRGIFSKKEISIPYRQIQDINIEQTFYFKMMGVSKLVVLTAGNDDNDKEGEAEGIFEVIDSSMAEKMREELLQKTNIHTS